MYRRLVFPCSSRRVIMNRATHKQEGLAKSTRFRSEIIVLPLLFCLGMAACIFVSAQAAPLDNSSIRIIPLSMEPPVTKFSGDPVTSSHARQIARYLREFTHVHWKGAKSYHHPHNRSVPNRSPSHQIVAPLPVISLPASSGLRMDLHPVGTPRRMQRLAADGSGRKLRGTLEDRRSPAISQTGDEDTVAAFLRHYREYLRLERPDEELQIQRKHRDELGRHHFRLAQRYHGLPVWPSELLVHLDPEGRVDLMNGSHIPTPRAIPLQPSFDADAALAIARTTLPEDVRAMRVQGSQLIVYAGTDRPARLAWKIDLSLAPNGQWRVLVDARNGAMLAAYATDKPVAAVGSGQDLFGATQVLHLWEENGTYYLLDISKSMFDPGSNPPNRSRGAIQILNARHQPTISQPEGHRLPRLVPVTSAQPDSGWLADGVSASANFSLSYDYYLQRQQRNSVDGLGGGIRAVVRFGLHYDNAFWSSDNQTMFFGDEEPFAGALDVTAHELTHGVTDYSVGLEYYDQSGALDEAFSDIFGEMVEAFANGGTDWIMGSRLAAPIRNLKNPASLEIEPGQAYPSKMSEYLRTQDDNGGVHDNSTIISHTYYLLAEGLDGAIGSADAERIFYRALTVHLTPRAQFADARLACIAAAEELFGRDSNQATKTAQAFDAVEIFEPSTHAPTPAPIRNIGEDSLVFVYFDQKSNQYFLGRRESFFNDPDEGIDLSWFPISRDSRPSVSADGRQVLFVNANHDLCYMGTNGKSVEECFGIDFIHAVVMAPDGQHFAYLQLDSSGNLEKSIYYYDSVADHVTSFDLRATASEGQAIDSIVKANAMDISLNNRYLVYDALNILTLEDGIQIDAWSIYAFDLFTGARMTVVPPVPGYDLSYPSLGKTSSSLLAFEATEQATGKTSLHIGNLLTGDQTSLAQVGDGYAVPVFTGDDLALLYTAPDGGAITGFSLWRQPLSADHLATAGEAQPWLNDGILGTVYRRGALTDLLVRKRGKGSGTVISDFEGIDCGLACSALYPPDTAVTLTAKADFGSLFDGWRGACQGKKTECRISLRKHETRVKARFIPSPRVRLKIAIEAENGYGNVTSLPSGIDCGSVCKGFYVKGNQVTLIAQPNSNSLFVAWRGACKSQTSNQCVLTLKRDRRVVAMFRGK